jgi:hypothetical protein
MPLPLVAAALLAATTASAPTSGVVVRVDRPAHLVAVAGSSGVVELVHVARLGHLGPGLKVRFSAQQLANGTLSAPVLTVTGHTNHATLQGVVLATSAKQQSLTLTAGGATLTLRLRTTPSPAGKHHGKYGKPVSTLPAVGSEVQLDVGLAGNRHTASSIHQLAASATGGSIEGVVVGSPGSTLRIAAGRTVVTLQVDTTTLDLSGVQGGQRVLAYFARQADGTLTLVALAQDGSVADADDASGIVGDVGAANATIDGTGDACTTDGTSVDNGPADDGSSEQGDDGDGSGTVDTSSPTSDGTDAGDPGQSQPSACSAGDGSGDATGSDDGSDGSDGSSDSGSLDSGF